VIKKPVDFRGGGGVPGKTESSYYIRKKSKRRELTPKLNDQATEKNRNEGNVSSGEMASKDEPGGVG